MAVGPLISADIRQTSPDLHLVHDLDASAALALEHVGNMAQAELALKALPSEAILAASSEAIRRHQEAEVSGDTETVKNAGRIKEGLLSMLTQEQRADAIFAAYGMAS